MGSRMSATVLPLASSPTHTQLLRPGEVLAAARRVPAAASAVRGDVDADAAFKSQDAFTSGWDDSSRCSGSTASAST
jgi:hypothetical protein